MKQFKIGFFAVIMSVIGIFPGGGFAQAAQDSVVTKVGEWGSGPYVDVFVQGNYAYCAAGGGGIDIIDIRNPSAPVQAAHLETTGYVYAVYVCGNYLYAATEGGLEIIRVSNPKFPASVGFYESTGAKYDVVVKGNYAYVADRISPPSYLYHLIIIDVTNPSSPTLVGKHLAEDRIMDLYVSGNYVYAAMASYTYEYILYDGGLEVIDVSTPSAPTLAASWDFVGYAAGVVVKNHYAYVLDYNHGLMIVDVSDPINPIQVGLFDDWPGTGKDEWADAHLYVEGDYAYVVGDHGGLHIIDVSDPTSPHLTGSNNSIGFATGVHTAGAHAYVADGYGGLKIFDISTPTDPSPVGNYDQSGDLTAVHAKDHYAYVVDILEGLRVIDVSDPTRPTLAASTAIYASDIDVKGNFAYLAGSFHIIDISNPMFPKSLAKLENIQGDRIIVDGNYAYLTGSYSGMNVVDISDPFDPEPVKGWESFNVEAVFVKGNYAYTVNSNGLQIIDVSEPTAPSTAGTCDIPGLSRAKDIYVKDNYAYVADRWYGLFICDVSDPRAPAYAGSCGTLGRKERLFVYGNYAYMVNIDKGLQIIDAANPAHPFPVETYTTPTGAFDVYVDAGYAYLVNGHGGKFIVLQLGQSLLPPGLSVDGSRLSFASDNSGNTTPPRSIFISNSGGGSLSWSLSVDQSWLKCSPASGTGGGEVSVSIDAGGLAPGTYNGTITISDPNAGNSPQTVTVTLTVYAAGQTSAPFGDFATPTHGAAVMSSVPVTGWVLDDIGVQSVQLFREENGSGSLVYIGDALFVEGARPDVEQAYPGYPMNQKAGWGYMMLTDFLPGGGNGAFNIHAIAADMEGNQVTLGVKTIICDNANAVKPFGAIDTPTQGGTASGTRFINWGWVLTPQPNRIPIDGSTINVWVDGIDIGQPTYNNYRADIAGLFPVYANSNGAVGYFYLDTTAYENGVHTIQWTAADDAGNIDGIGSRYFTIYNSAQGAIDGAPSAGHGANKEQGPFGDIPIDYSRSIKIRKGYDKDIEAQEMFPDENGTMTIEIKELERLEIHPGDGDYRAEIEEKRIDNSKFKIQNSKLHSASLVVGNMLRRLPIGSAFDTETGAFYWQPGVGFVGEYRFVFIAADFIGRQTRQDVIVNILPGF